MYDKGLLAKSTGASLGVVAVVGLLFMSTGTAFALPISGIGGFEIAADEIQGDDLTLYPGAGDASNITQYPQGVVELTETTIQGLELSKTFDLNNYGLSGNAKLLITSSGEVTSEELLLKTPKLTADEAVFSGLEIDESSTGGLSEIIELNAPSNPEQGKDISLSGGSNPGLVLTNPEIQATYLATNEITIPGLTLQVQFDPNNDGTYEYQV